MFFSKSLKNIDDKEYLGKEEYTILNTPNDPLMTYKGLKFSTQADLFIYKNQNYVNDNMRWLEIQTFKLYYDKKYSLQCLYIKNSNSIDKSQIMIYSQCFYTNFASTLPFLVDLSSFLKINIITYEYNNKDKQEFNYLDINILYNYLHKIEFIKNIILTGLSIGNKINMSIMLSKMNINSKSKLKAFIFISPTWVYDLSHLKQIKNLSSIKGDVGEFIEAVNSLKIPIFIAHGKQDTTVKYFLSVPFLQKINNKFEWLPKNGTHYDIINEHRTKLLIKLKEFFLNNNLLNSEKTHFEAFSKINEEEITNNKGMAERTTAFFNRDISNNDDKKNIDEQNIINLKINDVNDEGDDYYGHYNTNDIMGNKKNSNNKNNNQNKNYKNNNGLYTVFKSKIKDSDNNTLNQTIKDDDITINQNVKEEEIFSLNKDFKTFEEVSMNQDVNYNNITIGNNMEYDNITINQNIIQYDELNTTANNIPRVSTVSFIPGDIIPSFKNKNANPNQSFIYNKNQNRKWSRNISFMSFNV